MIKIVRVTGSSLSPFFLPGDYVLLLSPSLFFVKLQTGDTVVFDHPEHGRLIKKVLSVDSIREEIVVRGHHPESTDSRHFGPVPVRWLSGKVIWHIALPRS